MTITPEQLKALAEHIGYEGFLVADRGKNVSFYIYIEPPTDLNQTFPRKGSRRSTPYTPLTDSDQAFELLVQNNITVKPLWRSWTFNGWLAKSVIRDNWIEGETPQEAITLAALEAIK